jgi:hypothetical protein
MKLNLKFTKGYLFAYSIGLSVIAQFIMAVISVYYSRYVNDLSASEFPWTKIFDPAIRTEFMTILITGFIQTTLFIFLYWLLVRWIASTAKGAGRSYLAFMLFAIFLPVIAWIVVITFKKPIQHDI